MEVVDGRRAVRGGGVALKLHFPIFPFSLFHTGKKNLLDLPFSIFLICPLLTVCRPPLSVVVDRRGVEIGRNGKEKKKLSLVM
jgi:hypothetical protein